MKNIVVLLLLLSFQAAHAGGIEREAFVPDEATAIAIAKAVLIPIFGITFEEHRIRQTFSKRHNFYASLNKDKDLWVVEDAPPHRKKWDEPILRVEIDKKRGCIQKVIEMEY